MKKFLSLIMVLLLAFSMTACGNKKEQTNSNNTDAEVETEVNVEEDTAVTEEDALADEELSDESADTEKDESAKPQDKPDVKPQEEPKPVPENKPVEDEPKTLGNSLLAEFKTIASSGNALTVAEKLSASQALSELSMGAVSVEPGYLNGFDNAEITGFSDGAMFCPMIGTIPFVGYVFTLAEGTSASDFISLLKTSANLRWNICAEAEEMVAGSSGNKVFFVMCNKSLEE